MDGFRFFGQRPKHSFINITEFKQKTVGGNPDKLAFFPGDGAETEFTLLG